MSVSSVNDKNLDVFAAAQARSRDEDREGKTDTPDAAAVETSFSQMLKGRLSGNMVFTRLDQQLSVPQRAEPDTSRSPVADRREQAPKDNGVDPYDPNDDLQESDRRAPPSAAAADKAQPKSADPAATGATAGVQQTAANTNNPASQTEGTSRTPGKTAAEAGADQANATTKAAVQTAANTVTKGESVTPEVLEQAKQAAKSGTQKIAATVTDEGGHTSSQPQSTLGARAAVNADAAQRQGDGTTLQMQADADSLATAEAEGSANNIFNRLKAQTGAGKGNEEGKGQDAAEAAKSQSTPPPQPNLPQGAAITPGLAATTGGQFSALTGTAQSSMVVDGATGGTATLGENNSLQQRSATNPATNASRPPPVPPHIIAEQVAVNVQRGLAQGQDRITVQLRPQELGRVEIKMDMGHDGKMTAVVSAERPETLDMLRQDSRTLIQSLNDAGLQLDQSSLSFSLQSQNDGGGSEGDTAQGNGSGTNSTEDGDDPFQTGFHFEETGGFSNDGRLDVRI